MGCTRTTIWYAHTEKNPFIFPTVLSLSSWRSQRPGSSQDYLILPEFDGSQVEARKMMVGETRRPGVDAPKRLSLNPISRAFVIPPDDENDVGSHHLFWARIYYHSNDDLERRFRADSLSSPRDLSVCPDSGSVSHNRHLFLCLPIEPTTSSRLACQDCKCQVKQRYE